MNTLAWGTIFLVVILGGLFFLFFFLHLRPFTVDIAALENAPRGTYACNEAITDESGTANYTLYASRGLMRIDIQQSGQPRHPIHIIVADDGNHYVWREGEISGIIMPVGSTILPNKRNEIKTTMQCARKITLSKNLFRIPPSVTFRKK